MLSNAVLNVNCVMPSSPGMTSVVAVILQQDVLQTEREVDGWYLPVREAQIEGAAPEIRAVPPSVSLGVKDSLESPSLQGPPGLQGGVQGEVVGEGAVESEATALLQNTEVGRVSAGHRPLPHCEQHLLGAQHGPVLPGEVAAIQTTVLGLSSSDFQLSSAQYPQSRLYRRPQEGPIEEPVNGGWCQGIIWLYWWYKELSPPVRVSASHSKR